MVCYVLLFPFVLPIPPPSVCCPNTIIKYYFLRTDFVCFPDDDLSLPPPPAAVGWLHESQWLPIMIYKCRQGKAIQFLVLAKVLYWHRSHCSWKHFFFYTRAMALSLKIMMYSTYLMMWRVHTIKICSKQMYKLICIFIYILSFSVWFHSVF